MSAIDGIKEHADTIGVLIGSPARNPRKEGKDLFNAVFLLYEKEIKSEIHKTLLPNYDVFDEYRYFEPAFEWNVMEFKGKKLRLPFVKISGTWVTIPCTASHPWRN